MKLPEEIQATVKYFSNDEINIWERIVRDCAKVCAKKGRSLGQQPNPYGSEAAYLLEKMILHRYSLEPKEQGHE